jgi:hypothetical protein
VCSYIGTNEDLHSRMASGEVKVEVTPQGTLAERMRAAGAGIPAFFTPTGVGTVVAEGKETREIDGRDYLLEKALPADFALIRARTVDRFGNLRFYRTARNFSPIMATAARTTVSRPTSSSTTARSIPTTCTCRHLRAPHRPRARARGSVRVQDHAQARASSHDRSPRKRWRGAPRPRSPRARS